ncbi:MAG: C4-dicarboxylate TRAP transporter substrate-binding protein [Minwuiales bacterium]|nr:C4-dicarboxylate TRAP transporter substrate-binding protein [Minwuiales bacterium]
MKPFTITKAATVAVVAAFGLSASGAWAQNVNWNLSVWGKPRAFTKGLEEVSRQVEENSGGKFKIKIHYGEALSKARENLDGIKIGAFQMAAFCASYHPAKTPTLSGLDLPFLPFGDLNVQQRVHETYYAHPAVVADLARWNARILMTSLLPQYEFMGVGEPPRSLEAWQGKQVRALGGIGKAMTKLGAVPTTSTAPETYQLLERGTVYAASWPFSYAHAAYRLYEISDWFTGNLSPGAVTCPVVINTKAWDKLPKEYQDILTESRLPAYEVLKEAYKAADAKNLPMFKEKGLQEVRYSDDELATFRSVGAQPVWDDWVKEQTANGLPAQELLDLILNTAKGES